jgi:hypothetical protein
MWKQLTIDDLKLVLAQDEIDKLEERSVEMENVINSQLDIVADLFRGAWKAKGYKLDVREHYVAPEYIIPILNYARWQIWTRFPMTENYSLSEPRQKGYEEAAELLKDPYIGVSDPADPNDPDNPNKPDGIKDAAISIPYLIMDNPYIGFAYEFEKFKK